MQGCGECGDGNRPQGAANLPQQRKCEAGWGGGPGERAGGDGVLEVKLLYLTDDDARPVQAATRLVPFHYDAEVPGITEESIWYLEPGLEQLTAVMAGGGQAELRGVITLDLLVLQPEKNR